MLKHQPGAVNRKTRIWITRAAGPAWNRQRAAMPTAFSPFLPQWPQWIAYEDISCWKQVRDLRLRPGPAPVWRLADLRPVLGTDAPNPPWRDISVLHLFRHKSQPLRGRPASWPARHRRLELVRRAGLGTHGPERTAAQSQHVTGDSASTLRVGSHHTHASLGPGRGIDGVLGTDPAMRRDARVSPQGPVTSRESTRRLRGSLRTDDVNDIHTSGRTASTATQGARVVCTM
jgi:hypothetical protein